MSKRLRLLLEESITFFFIAVLSRVVLLISEKYDPFCISVPRKRLPSHFLARNELSPASRRSLWYVYATTFRDKQAFSLLFFPLSYILQIYLMQIVSQ